jgi:hypothetical protein
VRMMQLLLLRKRKGERSKGVQGAIDLCVALGDLLGELRFLSVLYFGSSNL